MPDVPQWAGAQAAAASAGTAGVPVLNGKAADLTGPRRTGRWGVTCADLGASVSRPNGKLVSVFGDTFSGRKVGRGRLALTRCPDRHRRRRPRNRLRTRRRRRPDYARQLWHYTHDDAATGWTRGGISTVIPPTCFASATRSTCTPSSIAVSATVIWTEIWRSDDSGVSWTHMGEEAKFPADLHGGLCPMLVVGLRPDDGWVYVVATRFQRDKGIILHAGSARHIGDRSRYSAGASPKGAGRGAARRPRSRRRREVGRADVSPDGARRMDTRRLPLVEVRAGLPGRRLTRGEHAHRTAADACARLGVGSRRESHREQVAQLYGGYVLPGSRFDIEGGFGLIVSQWNTDHRMALPGNAIQGRRLRTPRRPGAGGPDQPVS